MLYRTSKLNVFEKIAKSDLATQHPYTIVKALGGKTRRNEPLDHVVLLRRAHQPGSILARRVRGGRGRHAGRLRDRCGERPNLPADCDRRNHFSGSGLDKSRRTMQAVA